MTRMRFIMVGGFLGAGKTTAIARLGRHYLEQDRRVGVVTNDQAHGLVDTHSLRSQGFPVGEVPGACFCCKFEDLVETIGQLQKEYEPDIVITEPVGSCTDLVATVIEPLRELHHGEFDIAPLTVLLKPEHGLKILSDAPRMGFSPDAAYIFLKQIEEADVVAVNKIDKLTASQQTDLVDRVRRRYPEKEILLVSGKTGLGFDRLIDAIDQTATAHACMMDVDYRRYADGEAELGWLNATYQVTSNGQTATNLDDLAVGLLDHIRTNLRKCDAEPAHLKVLCDGEGQISIANLVGSDEHVELSVASEGDWGRADVIVNARAATDPQALEDAVEASIASLASSNGITFQMISMERFRPGAPMPTHRIT